MAVLSTVRVPVESSYVFPNGFLLLGIEQAMDFELRGKVDDWQARDKETGLRLWIAVGINMELMYDSGAEPGGFRRSAEEKVRIVSATRPVPPPAQVPGFGPVVEFDGLTLTPYADQSKCTAPEPGRAHRCRARQAYSLRASGMRAFSGLVSTEARPSS